MRILVSGHNAGIFYGVLQKEKPDWEVRAFRPHDLPDNEVTDGDYDVYILADDWGAVHRHVLPNLPVKKPTIAFIDYYYPQWIKRLRENSVCVEPMPMDLSVDEIPTYIESVVRTLREELASPDREALARSATEKLLQAV